MNRKVDLHRYFLQRFFPIRLSHGKKDCKSTHFSSSHLFIENNYTGQQIHVCSYSKISSPFLATIPCNFSFRWILESSVKMLDFNSCLVTVSSSLLSKITSKSLSTIGSNVSSRRSKRTYKLVKMNK